MSIRRAILCPVTICLLFAGAARCFAQAGIDPAHKFCWQENVGYMNWSGAPPAQAVSVYPGHLRGWIWCENIGWVSVGQGPADDVRYGNTGTSDYGVNRLGAGMLNGFAWSENAGWINFAGGALASPPNPARFDAAAGRFRGFAWAENLGWVNLDHASVYVATVCRADQNGDGQVTPQDLFTYLAAWFAKASSADVNGNGTVTPQDLFDFLRLWFARC